jgi:probable F420-dependent oxidoreductase
MKIGAVIMLTEQAALGGRAPSFQEIRSQALRCEQLGFDSLWLYDHLLYHSGRKKTITGIWEGWSMLSALAASTQRVELGTLVTCNSFRNPALLAKMAHTVDEISSGRLILGLGAGWNEPEYQAFGFPFDHRVSRFEEALQIVRPLLKEGRVDFQGKYYTARDCEITPRSSRPGGPPLLVGAFGPRMLRLAAQYADLWNWGYISLPRALVKPRQALRKACAAVGRDPATLPISGMVSLAYPDLLGQEKATRRGSLTGSPAEIAAAMTELEALGCVHLMFHPIPATPEAYELLAEAMAIYRKARK